MLQRTQDTAEGRRLENRLVAEADRCVKCGLCQPECPTYALSRSEADSPRGRIALIEGLASGRLEATAQLDRHLDGCLLCRRCERVCPSGVQFGELMDSARRLTLARRPAWLRWTVGLLSRPDPVGHLLRLGRLAPPLGGRLGQFARLAGAADRQRPPAPGSYPATTPQQGRVGLFLGCVGRHTHAGSLHAALQLLRRAGFEVVVPADQGCCGALHAHLGDAAHAGRLATALHRSFDLGLDAIVSVATGCGAHLQDSPEHRELPAPHADVLSWLADRGRERLRWRALAARVAVHTPCSQRNVLRGEAAAMTLLGRIPELQLQALPGNDRCCGAAGSFLLSHPDTAEALRSPKLAAIAGQRPDWVVTSNPGCALHLVDGLRRAGQAVPVVHPVELLAAQLVET
jgi:glycolate oxidase iron-sulfur subunit